MRICRLTIRGFRGVATADVRFGKHSVLVGPNNCGKTTIVEALSLLFGRDRMVRRLTEHDFYGSAPTEKSRIIVVATITDFPTNDPAHYPTWIGATRGTEKWLDPDTHQLHHAPHNDKCVLGVQVGFAARFDLDDLEAETIRFFVDDEATLGDPFSEDGHAVTQLSPKTVQELGFFFVPASRNWDRWISFSSELFRRVVSSIGGMPAAAIREERARLWNPDVSQRLEKQNGLKDIVSATNKELAHLMSSVPELELRLTATDSASVLETVVPHYAQQSGPSLPASRHGSGLVSLQSLLLLMQFGRARAEKGESFVLAVEEPELHIQPAQQKRLVNRVNALCDQTIVTTHSPLIASMFSPREILFAESSGGVLTVRPLADPVPAQPSNHVQHLFFGWRQRLIAALMHERVLVPEGPSDVAWLEALQRELELQQEWEDDEKDGTRFGTFVGVVPTNDAKVVDTLGVVQNVHSHTAALLDGDGAGEQYLAAVRNDSPRTKTVIIWPDEWTMETVVGWLVAADESSLLSRLSQELDQKFSTLSDLVAALLDKKSYAPTQELTAALIIANDAARKRTSDLLGSIADVLKGSDALLFEHLTAESTATTKVLRLKP